MSGRLHLSPNRSPGFIRRNDNVMCSKVTMNVKPFNRSEKFVILQIGRVLSPRVSCESTEIQIHAILN